MHKNEIKVLCEYLGGSNSYGLNTPESDVDQRGVMVHTDIAHLVGFDKEEFAVAQNDEQDSVFYEFRRAIKLLRNGNTQIMELLYNDHWISCSPIWKKVIEKRKYLVDSKKLFSCLRGYLQGEIRLAMGERTGKLGGKRFEQLQKFGYNPKNVVQAMRLVWAGAIYFQHGHFPVYIPDEDKAFAERLMEIKTQPQKFKKEDLRAEILSLESDMVKAFENRTFNSIFSEDVANQLCLMIYGPLIAELQLESEYKIK